MPVTARNSGRCAERVVNRREVSKLNSPQPRNSPEAPSIAGIVHPTTIKLTIPSSGTNSPVILAYLMERTTTASKNHASSPIPISPHSIATCRYSACQIRLWPLYTIETALPEPGPKPQTGESAKALGKDSHWATRAFVSADQ
jgi:hypothetical protein